LNIYLNIPVFKVCCLPAATHAIAFVCDSYVLSYVGILLILSISIILNIFHSSI